MPRPRRRADFVILGYPRRRHPAPCPLSPSSRPYQTTGCCDAHAFPRYVAAITPAAGPDSTINTGFSLAAAKVNTPPLDCMTRSSASSPAGRKRRLDVFQIASDERAQTHIDDGRAARVYSRISGSDLGRKRNHGFGKDLAQNFARGFFVRGIQVGVQKTHRDGFDLLPAIFPPPPASRLGVERGQHIAARVKPSGNTEGEIARHEWTFGFSNWKMA